MRLLFAGLFVFAGLMALVALVGSLGGFESVWGVLGAPVLAMSLILLMVLAFGLFSKRLPLRGKSPEEYNQELREQGLLVEEQYTAKRAFAVEETEDEGSTYFVELEDGRVLFLTGQYLYDYEPITDDPELNQPRTFPCTEFTVVRHKEKGYAVDMKCGGRVFEPEVTTPPFSEEWYDEDFPEDGSIITDVTYDDLKKELLRDRS